MLLMRACTSTALFCNHHPLLPPPPHDGVYDALWLNVCCADNITNNLFNIYKHVEIVSAHIERYGFFIYAWLGTNINDCNWQNMMVGHLCIYTNMILCNWPLPCCYYTVHNQVHARNCTQNFHVFSSSTLVFQWNCCQNLWQSNLGNIHIVLRYGWTTISY